MKRTKVWKRFLGLAVSLTMLCPSAAVYAKEGEPSEQAQKQEEAAALSAQADEDGFAIDENGVLTKYTGTDTKVVVPERVTSIGGGAFLGCSGLTSIELPSGVTSIGGNAFYNCSGLTSIELPSSLTELGTMVFYGCDNLINITVAEGNKTYKSYDGCLYNASGNELIYCPAGKKEVILLDSITSIAKSALIECSGLTSIELPNGLTSIGEAAFKGCSGLTSIELPNGLTKIGNGAFRSCSGLTSIELPSSLSNLDMTAFEYCDNLTNITVAEGNRTYKSYDGCIYNTALNELKCCPAGKEEIKLLESVSSIGYNAFNSCSKLTNIELPSGLTSIGSGAFQGCSGLTSIELPSGVTSIGFSAFRRCSSLTRINLPDGISEIADSAFYQCHALSNIGLPSGVTSIGGFAFYGCDSLTEMKLPSEVTEIGDLAFVYCQNLTSIELPDGMTSIGREAFYGCGKLTGIELPSSVTSIGGNAFEECGSLTIYGETGSYAESYAKENNIPFESVGEPSQPVQKELSECQISLSAESYVYDGTKKSPAVTIKDGSKVLAKDVDYAIAYKNNVNAGKAAVTVTGKGSYTGTVTKSYQITHQNISKAKAELSKTSYIYDGAAKNPTVSVTLDKKQLEQNTDYTITYANNTNVGTATVTVTGKGNYTGTVKASFQVTAKSINKAKVELSQSSYTYDGKAKKPAVTVTLDKKKLSGKTDYTVSYANNTKAGTATVTVTGKDNYAGTVKTTFAIKSSQNTKKSISKASVSLKKSSYVYDGKTKKPAVTVKLGKTTLKANRDYTVSYKGNKNIGTATVTVTGKGNYTGKVSKTFTIAAKKGTSFTVGGNKYKILSATQVSFTGIKNTKATKAVIPATVKIGGKTFKVTSIAANALKNKTKVTSVTVGSNVTSIGSNAFYGCKKLGIVTIKSTKLKTVGKNAFKGIKSTAKIKVPKAKEKAYKKLLKGKGQGKKVKIVKA